MRRALLASLLFLAACSPSPDTGPRCGDTDYHWSATEPSINLRHVFCGDINRRGNAVGFHATLALGQPGVPELIPDSVEPAAPGRLARVFIAAQPQADGAAYELRAQHDRSQTVKRAGKA